MMKNSWLPSATVLCVGLGCVSLVSGGSGVSTIADVLDAEMIRHYHQDLLFTFLGDNRGFGPEHDLARDNIADTFEELGLTTTMHAFEYQGVTYHNVIGRVEGSGGHAQHFVVGAHFDSVNNPGADDNATGTALVMELARVFSTLDTEYSIDFVAFDREEQGKRGSIAYVADFGDDVTSALTFDMIGHDSGAYGMDIYATPASSSVVNAIAEDITDYGGDLAYFLNTGTFTFSDHWSFESQGIPACVIIERSYILNPHYHQPTDAVDIFPGYINYDMIADLGRASAVYLADLVGVGHFGDSNSDGNVDLVDFAQFQLCFSGPSPVSMPSAACLSAFDNDGDGDIDLVDFAQFQLAFTGAM